MLGVLLETDQECAAAVLEAEEGEPPDVPQADGVAEAGDEKVARVAPPSPLGIRRHRRRHRHRGSVYQSFDQVTRRPPAHTVISLHSLTALRHVALFGRSLLNSAEAILSREIASHFPQFGISAFSTEDSSSIPVELGEVTS